jgi:hypothetical protein
MFQKVLKMKPTTPLGAACSARLTAMPAKHKVGDHIRVSMPSGQIVDAVIKAVTEHMPKREDIPAHAVPQKHAQPGATHGDHSIS